MKVIDTWFFYGYFYQTEGNVGGNGVWRNDTSRTLTFVRVPVRLVRACALTNTIYVLTPYTLNIYCLCLDCHRIKQFLLNNDHFEINLLFSQLGYFYLVAFTYSSYPININYLIFNSLFYSKYDLNVTGFQHNVVSLWSKFLHKKKTLKVRGNIN